MALISSKASDVPMVAILRALIQGVPPDVNRGSFSRRKVTRGKYFGVYG